MRKVALALIRKEDKYLVEKFKDSVSGKYFYKLIGGGIEDGETPQKALIREFREELSSELSIFKEFARLEDSFEYLGIKRDILAYILEAEFLNPNDSFFTQKFIYSPEGKFLSIAMWKTPAEIRKEKLELYPRPIIDKI